MKHLSICSLLFFTINCFAQQVPDRLLWSASRKLTVNNFLLRDSPTLLCQFTMEFDNINGFDFASRNFNNKVSNYFIPSASSINSFGDAAYSLRWAQLEFDLCEVYTRWLRKEMKAQRRTILVGMNGMKRLSDEALTRFAKRRLQLYQDTNHGSNRVQVQVWEKTVQTELQELAAYARKE